MHPLLPIHIAAGGVALLAGAVALAVRKGAPFHARAGTWFFLSMLVMAGTGAVIALALPERGTATIGILTCYLVATSWLAAKRRDGVAGRAEAAGMIVALACTVSFVAIILLGLGEPDGKLDKLPAAIHYPFAALAALAAGLDLNFLLRRELSGVQRIARHLWRMSTALLIAAFSFFMGQQQHFPEWIQGTFVLFVPPLAVLAAMIFWIVRVRFSRAYRWVRPRRSAPAAGPAASPRVAQEAA